MDADRGLAAEGRLVVSDREVSEGFELLPRTPLLEVFVGLGACSRPDGAQRQDQGQDTARERPAD
jgi:hypothetical protein